MNSKRLSSAFALAVAVFFAGCAADHQRTEEDYGKSVRQMVRGQTYDLNAAANPPADAPNVGDGPRLQTAVENHRKDVAKGAEQTRQDIVINVGD